MKLSQQERFLTDRYLDHLLSGEELHDFLRRMEEDKAFREAVTFHQLLRDGIRQADDQRLRTIISSRLKHRTTRVHPALKLTLVFLFLMVTGIVLWNYVGPIPEIQRYNFFSFRKAPSAVVNDTDTIAPPAARPAPAVSVQATAENIVQKRKESPADTAVNEDDESVIIRKDQLLISTSIRIAEHFDREGDILLQKTDTIHDEDNVFPSLMDVEFWVSPVNYEGYKLNHGKLILFGIEQPDQIMLYAYGQALIMKYEDEYFLLSESDIFLPFQQLGIESLPSALR